MPIAEFQYIFSCKLRSKSNFVHKLKLFFIIEIHKVSGSVEKGEEEGVGPGLSLVGGGAGIIVYAG